MLIVFYRTLAALGHDYGAWHITLTAACETVGTRELRCTRDQTVLSTETIAPLGHDYQNWTQTTAPTCTTAGIETVTCTHNATHTTTRTEAALGHDYQDWTQTTAPTCTAAGIETGTCIRDGSTTTRAGAAVDSNAHDYQWVTIAPSYIEVGTDKEICSRCADENGNTRNQVSALTITTTQQWNEALALLNGKTGSYILTIGGNFAVAGSADNTFGTTVTGSTLTVTLKGTGRLYLDSQGSIIRIGANQTLIIDSAGLILEGLTNGKNGATQDNSARVVSGGKLELKNGTISGNTGGGVSVSTFTMSGGEISGNTATRGGGVLVSGGTFTMSGGKISGNTATANNYPNGTEGGGGGVCVYMYGTFTMSGGEISGNIGGIWGRQVYMIGTYWAGDRNIYEGDVVFSKIGGTITVTSGNQIAAIAWEGRAYANEVKTRNTTAGPGVNLGFSSKGREKSSWTGGWN